MVSLFWLDWNVHSQIENQHIYRVPILHPSLPTLPLLFLHMSCYSTPTRASISFTENKCGAQAQPDHNTMSARFECVLLTYGTGIFFAFAAVLCWFLTGARSRFEDHPPRMRASCQLHSRRHTVMRIRISEVPQYRIARVDVWMCEIAMSARAYVIVCAVAAVAVASHLRGQSYRHIHTDTKHVRRGNSMHGQVVPCRSCNHELHALYEWVHRSARGTIPTLPSDMLRENTRLTRYGHKLIHWICDVDHAVQECNYELRHTERVPDAEK